MAYTGIRFSALYTVTLAALCLVSCGESEDAEKDSNSKDTTQTSKAGAKSISEDEQHHLWAMSPDTSFSYRKDYPNKLAHDTGYIVANEHVSTYYYTDDWHIKKSLDIATWYLPLGSDYQFQEDREKTIPAGTRVRVLGTDHIEYNTHFGWQGHILISPLGTTDSFYIEPANFTLKDITRCDLTMKAKCEFLTFCTYVPPSNPADEPLAISGREKLNFPKDALILITEYERLLNRLRCKVIDRQSRRELNPGFFTASSLKEK